jgi:hypothetical protein
MEPQVISGAFNEHIMPIMIDIGRTIFMCTVAYATYYLMRKQYREGVERIKAAAIGYICLSGMNLFIRIVDQIAGSIK